MSLATERISLEDDAFLAGTLADIRGLFQKLHLSLPCEAIVKENPGSGVAGITGRDGAADFAAQVAMLNEAAQANHAYRVIELVGTSDTSIEDAIRLALARAHQTLRHLRWFEIVRTSGHIVDGQVAHFQVSLKVGFTLEGASDAGERNVA